MKSIKKALFVAFLGLLVIVGSTPASVEAQQAANFYVAITDNAYSNTYANVPVGTVVTWTNTGIHQHTVTADDGSFDSGTLGVNQSFTRTFNTVGTFRYYDRFFGGPNGSGMSATIVVGNGNTGGIYPVCSPSNQNVNINGSVQFSATGGNGTYTWNAPNASPTYGNGSYFTTSFYNVGTQTVTVTSNGYTSQCTVNVLNGTIPPITGGTPFCSPSIQNATVNDFVSFSATGGNGIYYWTAPNASPSTASGQTFGVRFFAPGTQTVTVTSNGLSSQCLVQVRSGQVLGVSDVSTGPEDVALWAIILGLLAAVFAYLPILKLVKKS